ncbi:uncharacterized protein BKA78DRAFT_327689 [Phyllosticta capitalensis]|uniref:uncharacterized protein n=1 Tax=Phyllosticta capitalensis TaxID=121624 RepID=UPI00313102A3
MLLCCGAFSMCVSMPFRTTPQGPVCSNIFGQPMDQDQTFCVGPRSNYYGSMLATISLKTTRCADAAAYSISKDPPTVQLSLQTVLRTAAQHHLGRLLVQRTPS